MPIIAKIIAGMMLALATAFAVFSWGQWVARNDIRMFHAYDLAQEQQRVQFIARACGKRGTLWANPETGRYACMYEGSGPAMEIVPDELRAGVRLVRN